MKKPIKKLALPRETIRMLRLDETHGAMRPIPTMHTCTATDCEPPTLQPGCWL
jgi:hypothetical protein